MEPLRSVLLLLLLLGELPKIRGLLSKTQAFLRSPAESCVCSPGFTRRTCHSSAGGPSPVSRMMIWRNSLRIARLGPVAAPLSLSGCPPGVHGGHTLEVHRGRASACRLPPPTPSLSLVSGYLYNYNYNIFVLLSTRERSRTKADLPDHLSGCRGGAGRVYPSSSTGETAAAAVLPRPCIRAEHRGRGGGPLRRLIRYPH